MTKSKILENFKSEEIFKLDSYRGTVNQVFSAYGNAIVSSVYVLNVEKDTKVYVNYWDTTTGHNTGERYDIGSHDILTSKDSGKTKREIFRKIHNKIVCEIIIVGGSATLSVFATAITSDRDNEMDSILNMSKSSGFLEDEIYNKLRSYEVNNKHRILEYSNDDICQFQIVANADNTGFTIQKRDCEFLLLKEDGSFLLQETDFIHDEDSDKIKISGLIPL